MKNIIIMALVAGIFFAGVVFVKNRFNADTLVLPTLPKLEEVSEKPQQGFIGTQESSYTDDLSEELQALSDTDDAAMVALEAEAAGL